MPEQFSPVRLFVTLLVLIFCIEGAMMFALDDLLPIGTPVWVGASIDAGLLTAITSLFVWWLFMRPLRFALLSETAQAKVVMDTAVEGIVTVSERGVIESFNRAAERMFAYQAEEVIGKNVNIMMPEPHAGEHDNYLARYIRTGEARVIGRAQEFSALRKGGAEFPIELNVAEIRHGGTRHFTAIIRDVTERRQAEARIYRLAHYDSLTLLPNRSLFYDLLGQAISLARRDSRELALLYLDLDKFKPVNDALGHDAGDELLKTVADRLRLQVRESDTVARVGGDEFTLLLPVIADRKDAATVAEKIIAALSASFLLGKQEVRIGTSIGIAIYPADAGQTDALVKAADAAMYKAKQVRNSFRFYSE